MVDTALTKKISDGWQGRGMYETGYYNFDGKLYSIIIVAETTSDLVNMFSDFIRYQNTRLSPADACSYIKKIVL